MQIDICDLQVPVYGPAGGPLSAEANALDLNTALLYRWEIYSKRAVETIYIGRASKGQARPTITYPKIVRDLRASRGFSKLCENPVVPYFINRSPWGFRWIHHQLEAATHRILHEQDPREESAALFLFAVGIAASELNDRETQEIKTAIARYGTEIVANGKRSMAHHDRNKMDRTWTCSGDA